MPNQYLPGVNTIPNSLIITDISTSLPMVVTTTLVNTAPNPRVNTYKAGMNVRLYVPRTYGMYQANGLIGTILEIIGNVFLVIFPAGFPLLHPFNFYLISMKVFRTFQSYS